MVCRVEWGCVWTGCEFPSRWSCGEVVCEELVIQFDLLEERLKVEIRAQSRSNASG